MLMDVYGWKDIKRTGSWNLDEIPVSQKAWWEFPFWTLPCFPIINSVVDVIASSLRIYFCFPHLPLSWLTEHWLCFIDFNSVHFWVRTQWPRASPGADQVSKNVPILKRKPMEEILSPSCEHSWAYFDLEKYLSHTVISVRTRINQG